MTLSRWLRDYVYIPLGGNRKGDARTYANLMLTMLIGGLWHGAGWTFVVWGGIHGAVLAAGALAERPGDVAPRRRGFALWRRARRSRSTSSAWPGCSSAPTRSGPPRTCSSGSSPAGVSLRRSSRAASCWRSSSESPRSTSRLAFPRALMERFSRLPVVGQAAVLAFALMVTNMMGPEGVAPFIYFRF